jgi:predicted phosphodiesterase
MLRALGRSVASALGLGAATTRLEEDDADAPAPDVTIVHLSDTHGRDVGVLPPGDILIHTGDFTDNGTLAEYEAFDAWLGGVKAGFRHGVFVVLGNHDYKFLNAAAVAGDAEQERLVRTMAGDAARRAFMAARLGNATKVIDCELVAIDVGGESDGARRLLTIFGVPWQPWQSSPTHPDKVRPRGSTLHDAVLRALPADCEQRRAADDDGEAHRYADIPAGVDVLLTHAAPHGVLDMEHRLLCPHWGSSRPLLRHVRRAKPTAVLFGHVHAQRGYWERAAPAAPGAAMKLRGGCEYNGGATHDGAELRELMAADVQFAANSAVMSDPVKTPFGKGIVGAPRVIAGTYSGGAWAFRNVSRS